MHKKRIKALIERFKKHNIEGMLVTKPENVFYLTSLITDKIVLAITPKKNFAITDFIYAEAAARHLRDFELFVAKDRDSFSKAISSAARRYKIKSLGFESLSSSFSWYKTVKEALKGRRLVATEDVVESLREIKEKGEIPAIKKALKITTETFKAVKNRLRPAATELAISRYIKESFVRKGADGYSFEPIVAGQPSASQPHYTASSRKLGSNKAILIDIGARLKGYNSDLTRMCPLGKISTKFSILYAILRDAQQRAIERIRPGARISDIDSTARQYIASKGLGRFFGHDLGHGIGLEIHEKPTISRHNKDTLKEDMVFTVEPGIYIPGYGGLRIEDVVRVTKRGCEVLTDDIDKSI